MARLTLGFLLCCTAWIHCVAYSQESSATMEAYVDVPYSDSTHERQVLDIYSSKDAKNLPVVFWIHGGGWQAGDKSDIQEKPVYFINRKMVFVSTNYRLLPEVEMGELIRDVAKSLRWVQDNISEYGGDPKQIYVMGHSAGAQLAAILCTDHRYLQEQQINPNVLLGCVPVDGDTFDIPAIIETAETRRRVHLLPQAKFGHREKFGNSPEKHVDFSAVTHIKAGQKIPPFLVLHVADHPDTTAQAQRLVNALQGAGFSAKAFGAKDTDHSKLNQNLGSADDPATIQLTLFLDELQKSKP